MYRIHTIEGEVACTNVLIDNGVPMKEADDIVDSLVADPPEEVEDAIVAEISCWSRRPRDVLGSALNAAQEADERVSI